MGPEEFAQARAPAIQLHLDRGRRGTRQTGHLPDRQVRLVVQVDGGALPGRQSSHRFEQFAARVSGGTGELAVGQGLSLPRGPEVRSCQPERGAVEPRQGVADVGVVHDRPCEGLRHRVIGDVAPSTRIGVQRPPQSRAHITEQFVIVMASSHDVHHDRATGGAKGYVYNPRIVSEQGAALYDRVGGMSFFEELIERFYEGVGGDGVLIAMYPDDLTEPKRNLALFIAQYFGGPSEYHEARGAPQLRMRHFPFAIDDDVAARWVTQMRAALAQMDAPEDCRAEMDAYFEYSAFALRNQG